MLYTSFFKDVVSTRFLTGFANFIDEWSQCDFCFTNFGVILEYLESSITTKKSHFQSSGMWSWHVYVVVNFLNVYVVVNFNFLSQVIFIFLLLQLH